MTINPKKRTVRPNETPTVITTRKPTSSLSSVMALGWRRRRAWERCHRRWRTSPPLFYASQPNEQEVPDLIGSADLAFEQ